MCVKKFILILISISFFSGCQTKGPGHTQKKWTVSTLIDLKASPNEGFPANMLPEPAGISIHENDLFFTDSYNHTIGRLDLNSGKWEVIAGTYQLKGDNDGPGKTARFNSPFGMANDGKFLYVADTGNNVIRLIDMKTHRVSTLMGKPGVAGAIDGKQDKGLLRHPYGLALDGSHLYVADSGNSTIRRISLDSKKIKTIAGISGVAGVFDGPVGTARFNSPRGVAVDSQYIYVADTINGAIRQVSKKTGEVKTLAGTPFRPGSSDGKGSSAGFNNPTSLTLLGKDLIIVDMQNNMIRKIDLTSTKVTTIAGKEEYGAFVGIFSFFPCVRAMADHVEPGFRDGKSTQARFNFPFGVFTDGSKIIISDMRNHAIRLLN